MMKIFAKLIHKVEKALLVAVGTLALTAFFCLVALHLNDQLNWRSYFSGLYTFGNDCRCAMTAWPGDFELAKKATPDKACRLPRRGQADARQLTQSEMLVVSCDLDLKHIAKDGFAILALGRIFGLSTVWLNDQKIATTQGGDRLELQVPIDARGSTAELTIISRPEDDGIAGMHTLTPPYITTNASAHQMIVRYLASYYAEQTNLRIGTAIVLLGFFCGLLAMGFKYSDVKWMAIFSACVLIQSAAIYWSQFGGNQISQRIQGSANVGILFAQIMFIVTFTRMKSLTPSLNYVIGVPAYLLILLILFCNDKTFFDYRLLIQGPTKFGIIGTAIVSLAILTTFIKTHHELPDKQRIRTKRVLALALCTLLILMVQLYFDERFNIYILPFAQALTFLLFSGVLLRDLVIRQFDYFEERKLRIKEEQSRHELQKIVETVKYLAHDLKRPTLLLATLKDSLTHASVDDLKQQIEQLCQASERADSLLDDLLYVDGDRPLELTANSVREMCYAAIKSVQLLYPQWPIEVEYVGRDANIFVDVQLFGRVLENIMVNAVQAVTGPTKFLITTTSNHRTVLSIRNFGSVVPESMLAHMFQFGTSDKKDGHGIGLAFCRAAIEKHGGKIWCNSANNSTEFAIELPRPRQSTDTLPLHIAIVDDDEFVLMKWNMGHPNVTIDTFTSPYALLERCRREPTYLANLHALILDRNYGKNSMDGVELGRQLRLQKDCPPLFMASFQKIAAAELQPIFIAALSKKSPSLDTLMHHLATLSAKQM